MPQGARPVKLPGLRALGESIATYGIKCDAERAQTRHPHRANCEILVIGIDFQLHRALHFEFVFFFVGGDRPV